MVRPIRLHFQKPVKPYEDRFDKGVFYNWLRGKSHWIPSAKRVNQCSPDQCIVCAGANPQAFDLDLFPNLDLAKFEPKGYTAVSGWIEEWFHLREKKRDNGDGTYKVRELCEGRDCEGCRDKVTRVFGQRFWYAFTETQWSNCIEPILDKVSRSCRCGGYLFPSHYRCEKCDTVLFDMTNSCPHCGDSVDVDIDPDTHAAECKQCGRQWSLLECEDDRLEEMADSIYVCPKCEHSGYPRVKLVCSNGCKEDGDPHDIFDAQITLHRDSDQKQYNLLAKSFKIQPPDPKLFDPQYQGGGEDGNKIVGYHKECLDLEKVLPLLPPHAQAREIHFKNPWAGQDMGSTHARYSTPDERSE